MLSIKPSRVWIKDRLDYMLEQSLKDHLYTVYHGPSSTMYLSMYHTGIPLRAAITSTVYAPGGNLALGFASTSINKVIDAFY
jgi:hypothetical protein